MIASDAGRIIDDGTIARLDDDSFYVTTTSSGAGAVEEWFTWWLADWKLDARVTDLTQGMAAVNLAGPRAREIMASVTDIDCSAEAFKYLDAKQATIAGVRCLVLRIGFVGEVGYEIHCPAAFGEHIWDALMAAGQPHGLRPFGLEPQRVLRLQKMHILVGQDTDSESTPYGAAMPWIVKLDKEQDFIGQLGARALLRADADDLAGRLHAAQRARSRPRARSCSDRGQSPAGQVTSSSAIRRCSIARSGWPGCRPRWPTTARELTISDEGRQLLAEVQTRPFYDPDGEVLRS